MYLKLNGLIIRYIINFLNMTKYYFLDISFYFDLIKKYSVHIFNFSSFFFLSLGVTTITNKL